MTNPIDTVRYMTKTIPGKDLALLLQIDDEDGDTRMMDAYALRAEIYNEALAATNKDAWATDPCSYCCPNSYIRDILPIDSCRRCGRGRYM